MNDKPAKPEKKDNEENITKVNEMHKDEKKHRKNHKDKSGARGNLDAIGQMLQTTVAAAVAVSTRIAENETTNDDKFSARHLTPEGETKLFGLNAGSVSGSSSDNRKKNTGTDKGEHKHTNRTTRLSFASVPTPSRSVTACVPEGSTSPVSDCIECKSCGISITHSEPYCKCGHHWLKDAQEEFGSKRKHDGGGDEKNNTRSKTARMPGMERIGTMKSVTCLTAVETPKKVGKTKAIAEAKSSVAASQLVTKRAAAEACPDADEDKAGAGSTAFKACVSIYTT